MKKKILFIIPTLNSCGTNSSLSSIYNTLCNVYDFSVLPIKQYGNGEYAFIKKNIYSDILDIYYSYFSELKGWKKIISLILKIIRTILSKFNIDIESIICKSAIKKIEKKYNFDYIIGFQEGMATKVASHFCNSNKIAWIHCDYERSVAISTNEEAIYIKFKNIICVSRFTYNKFCKRYPNLKDKTQFIYNLLDIERIKYLAKEPIDDNKFNTTVFTILSVGRMDSVKGFTSIPLIASNIKNNGLKFRWYILGGPLNKEYTNISNLIKKYNVEENVILLGNKSNPYPYFKYADLYVSTSFSEACPMVFNEARIFGIPIVTTNFGSAYEFVNNNIDGYISKINDIQYKIEELISNYNKYNIIKKNSEEYIINNKKNINKIENLFR